tara:strand:- start:443 stop:742 length:300 start_codon:yes stop_codon:yes gene_type:complete
MKKLIQALISSGASLNPTKSGIGFVVYNVKPIQDNLDSLTELAEQAEWNLKLYPSTTSFDPKTGEKRSSRAKYLVAPMIIEQSLSEEEALAAAQKMIQS